MSLLSSGGMEESKVEAKKEEEEEEIRWANHYSSVQQILLVGEGDFSFSLSLANAFCSASNIIATSLDSYDAVLKKYSQAKSNLESLKKRGASILHEVDATKMKFHTDLKMRKFDRIMFNFPHAGFKGKEDQIQVIKQLVRGFFRNASHMLRPYGEIHVSHKTGSPYRDWNLEKLASTNSLMLIECTDFRIEDYPGYNNKRGDGPRSDQPFRLGECSTFKFKIGDIHRKKKPLEVPSLFENFSRSSHPPAIGHPHEVRPRTDFLINLEGIQRTLHSPPRIGISNVYLKEPEGHVFDACQVFQSLGHDYAQSIQGSLRNGYQVYTNEASGRTLSGSLRDLELHNRSLVKQEWLRGLVSSYGQQVEGIHFR